MFVTEFVWRQSSCDCVKMSKVQMLSLLVKQRLTAAAEEISGLFERTIAEYEEELCRSQEENERQRKLLDAVLQPRVQLHRAGWFWLVLLTSASHSVQFDTLPPECFKRWSSRVKHFESAILFTFNHNRRNNVMLSNVTFKSNS